MSLDRMSDAERARHFARPESEREALDQQRIAAERAASERERAQRQAHAYSLELALKTQRDEGWTR